VSYLLKPDPNLLYAQFYLSKCIANGILEGLQAWAHQSLGSDRLPLEIKWPNDIYLDGKKLGGILIEIDVSDSIIFMFYLQVFSF
jgi:BirA family biotin operon repressor/biotin-[acetyl-CoA-carboxylase] ligase